MKLMPQEIEVWYLIPALRKELAKILIKEFSLSQKKIADILGLTESAVSQYLKAKRANELKFSKTEQQEIKKIAKKIIADPKHCNSYVYQLTMKFRGTHNICRIHKKQDKSLPINCKICCE
jgi:predicted transcriptional regulator